MRVLLVKPKWFVKGGVYRYLEGIRFTPLHLGILAALSEGHEVRCVDGDWEAVPCGEDFDLVGVTATTFTSERAYAILDRFRAKGARTVIGGVHAALMPEECLEHADAVLVGEAEETWPAMLDDAGRGRLEGVYRAPVLEDLGKVPFPRRELLGESSWFACVQTTRGCTNSCRYCYLPCVPWGAFRKRPVGKVLEEMDSLRQPVLFVVDDNVFADRAYALDLFRGMRPLGKIWAVQAPTNVASDDEMLDAMRDAGCFNVQVGFQTVNPRSLDWADVRQNRVERYAEVVSRFHSRGFLVAAFFMYGFDHDGPDIFAETFRVAKEIGVDDAQNYILTPYPGTPLHADMRAEGRLLPGKDRSAFGWSECTFAPRLMSPVALERGVEWANQAMFRHFRKKAIWAVLSRAHFALRSPRAVAAMALGSFRRAHLRKAVD